MSRGEHVAGGDGSDHVDQPDGTAVEGDRSIAVDGLVRSR